MPLKELEIKATTLDGKKAVITYDDNRPDKIDLDHDKGCPAMLLNYLLECILPLKEGYDREERISHD